MVRIDDNFYLNELIKAITKNDINSVKELLEKGIDPNSTLDECGITPLHYAALYNTIDIVPLLITAGADLLRKNSDGETALDIATGCANYEMAELLKKFQIIVQESNVAD